MKFKITDIIERDENITVHVEFEDGNKKRFGFDKSATKIYKETGLPEYMHRIKFHLEKKPEKKIHKKFTGKTFDTDDIKDMSDKAIAARNRAKAEAEYVDIVEPPYVRPPRDKPANRGRK